MYVKERFIIIIIIYHHIITVSHIISIMLSNKCTAHQNNY